MSTLFDSSVLVPAIVERHPQHLVSARWLRRAISGEIKFFVGGHSLAEVYAVLTSLPGTPRISPGMARRLVRENIENHAKIVTLSASDYGAVLEHAAESGIAGGAIYDALLARAAQKAQVDYLLTFNKRDFLRVWPEGGEKILTP